MLRSFLAVVAGYLTMVVTVSAFLGLLLFALPGAFPKTPGPYTGPTYILWLELLFGLVAAIAGGYVCARIARRAELKHGLALMAVLVPFGIASTVMEAGLKPLWSSIALIIVGATGVFLGSALRRRHVRFS